MYNIPNHIMQCAKEVADLQGTLSNSPATKTQDGKVLLCAAACVAYAGILKSSDETQANNFMVDLVNSNGSELLNTKFEELGWSKKLCLAMRLENDSMPQANRLAWFSAL